MITKNESTEQICSFAHERFLVNIDSSTMACVLQSVISSCDYLFRCCDYELDECEADDVNQALEKEKMSHAINIIYFGMFCLLGNLPTIQPNCISLDVGKEINITDLMQKLKERIEQTEENNTKWNEWAHMLLDDEIGDFALSLSEEVKA